MSLEMRACVCAVAAAAGRFDARVDLRDFLGGDPPRRWRDATTAAAEGGRAASGRHEDRLADPVRRRHWLGLVSEENAAQPRQRAKTLLTALSLTTATEQRAWAGGVSSDTRDRENLQQS
jgi:hypothetical protein